ncbi:hypothetical protein HHK36_019558 [Tetracentron sinense]|uniref:Protein kinase domain-containing protein n=1 Tax=Tetracentron sinense TaxID=13715 RepID=A0A835D9Q3_TETSI|nr:hypothetical protein HHK36_019558 [Tetracentron sinense]
MGWFPCSGKSNKKSNKKKPDDQIQPIPDPTVLQQDSLRGSASVRDQFPRNTASLQAQPSILVPNRKAHRPRRRRGRRSRPLSGLAFRGKQCRDDGCQGSGWRQEANKLTLVGECSGSGREEGRSQPNFKDYSRTAGIGPDVDFDSHPIPFLQNSGAPSSQPSALVGNSPQLGPSSSRSPLVGRPAVLVPKPVAHSDPNPIPDSHPLNQDPFLLDPVFERMGLMTTYHSRKKNSRFGQSQGMKLVVAGPSWVGDSIQCPVTSSTLQATSSQQLAGSEQLMVHSSGPDLETGAASHSGSSSTSDLASSLEPVNSYQPPREGVHRVVQSKHFARDLEEDSGRCPSSHDDFGVVTLSHLNLSPLVALGYYNPPVAERCGSGGPMVPSPACAVVSEFSEGGEGGEDCCGSGDSPQCPSRNQAPSCFAEVMLGQGGKITSLSQLDLNQFQGRLHPRIASHKEQSGILGGRKLPPEVDVSEGVSSWVLSKIEGLSKFLGLSVEGHEEEFRRLVQSLEKFRDGSVVKPTSRRSLGLVRSSTMELRRLECSINYDRSNRRGAPRAKRVGKGSYSDQYKLKVNPLLDVKEEVSKDGGSDHIAAQIFTFRDLAVATKNFRADCLLGEGGNREFLVEVLMLSLLHHPNLVNLIGYCADGDQRLLAYEYMTLRSLEDHLHDLLADKKRLDWNTRMKIAAGAAKGLEYLHDKGNPPARPLFKDRRKFSQMADLMLQGQYPVRGLYQLLAVAAMCLQE